MGNVLNGSVKISGVTVTGTLSIGEITNATIFLYIGGILGELSASSATTITIKNCVSTLNISALTLGSKSTGSYGIRVGGLVGKEYNRNIIINDSYSSGNIEIVYGGVSPVSIGGLVGRIEGGNITVEHCYSTSVINSTKTGTGAHYVGGLIGEMGSATERLNNSVALNPSITVSGGTLAVNRAVGNLGNTALITNVYALSTMTVNGNTATTGAANNVNGADAASAAAVPWSTLGFTETSGWDMSVTPPVLK
jgi:hypothetical protein